jgi:DNA replicative helicase MCM subunit Mcm2 (Cdc46/Mcm family)
MDSQQLVAIKPKIVNLVPRTPFCDLKSSISGQLISICGHVLRVGTPTPYVTMGNFKCSKCNKVTQLYFRDGIYASPRECGTPK